MAKIPGAEVETDAWPVVSSAIDEKGATVSVLIGRSSADKSSAKPQEKYHFLLLGRFEPE